MSNRSTATDFAFQLIDMMPSQSGLSLTDKYVNRKILKGTLFDYLKRSTGDAYWAVELEFVGVNKRTRKKTKSIAMLQYGKFTVTGKKEEQLMYVFTGTTSQEIAIIRKNTKDFFNTMRKFPGMP